MQLACSRVGLVGLIRRCCVRCEAITSESWIPGSIGTRFARVTCAAGTFCASLLILYLSREQLSLATPSETKLSGYRSCTHHVYLAFSLWPSLFLYIFTFLCKNHKIDSHNLKLNNTTFRIFFSIYILNIWTRLNKDTLHKFGRQSNSVNPTIKLTIFPLKALFLTIHKHDFPIAVFPQLRTLFYATSHHYSVFVGHTQTRKIINLMFVIHILYYHGRGVRNNNKYSAR